MAKDGTNRGSRRVRAGRNKTPSMKNSHKVAEPLDSTHYNQ